MVGSRVAKNLYFHAMIPQIVTFAWTLFFLLWFIPAGAFSQGSWASSRHRTGRLEGVPTLLNLTQVTLTGCLQHCRIKNNCSAVQYSAASRQCQLLPFAICDTEVTGTQLSGDSAWRYYDILEPGVQPIPEMFDDSSICTSGGHCSANCARRLGGPCLIDEQCLATTDNSFCRTGVCSCQAKYWAYNSTLCIKQEVWVFNNWDWFGKRIVNGACEFNITVKAPYWLEIILGNLEEWLPWTQDNRFAIGWDNNGRCTLLADGAWDRAQVAGPTLNNTNQNFTIGFCNGKMRFGRQGEAPFLAYDDPTPFVVTYIGFRVHYQTAAPTIFFPYGLVDTYFPTSVETKTLRTNGQFWNWSKLDPGNTTLSKVIMHFSYKGPGDSHLLFGKHGDHSTKYQLQLNSGDAGLWVQTRGTWILRVATAAGFISGTEFRSFWIVIDDGNFRFGRYGDSTPILNYTPVSGVAIPTFLQLGYISCCHAYAYWQFHSHPEMHEHSEGSYIV